MAVFGCLCRMFQALPNQYGSLKQSVTGNFVQIRWKKKPNRPRLRFPSWFLKKERVKYNENLTPENKLFVKEIVEERFGPAAIIGGVSTYQQSPLKNPPLERGTWAPGLRRTGVIARKIGIYPMWMNDGTKVLSTLLQVVDNHVIRYTPPEEYVPMRKPTKRLKYEHRFGCLLVGAESEDPQVFTKEYCGLFTDSGVMPKKVLGKFMISPEAFIQPGTPLFASHFRAGQYVDIRGKTVDRGFQGVMKRWGFKGMPASHGVTKTHRRPGNIGGGGEKGRVWPGKKMPGHMGNRHRILRGVQILRINTKYNVLWVKGPAIAGETNTICYIYDTILPLKQASGAPYFPTFYPEDLDEPLPDEVYSEEMHPFSSPTITFQDTK